jgi:F0F1-type ATP synthase membrane subunit b/b'
MKWSICGPARNRLRISVCLLVVASAALPVLAQEGAPSPADSSTGFVFRWVNLLLLVAIFWWVIAKFGGPYFRSTAKSIQAAVAGAAAGRAAAERELNEANRQLASLDAEVQEMRSVATRETANEAERLRALAKGEADKIAKAVAAEIEAAERAAAQQLRALAAQAAAERAAALVRERLNQKSERALFDGFVAELEREAR